MKRAEITVPWPDGLHARQAGILVRTACKFGSSIRLRHREKVANARSIISLLLLCATMGTTVEVEVVGEDEESALKAVKLMFERK